MAARTPSAWFMLVWAILIGPRTSAGQSAHQGIGPSFEQTAEAPQESPALPGTSAPLPPAGQARAARPGSAPRGPVARQSTPARFSAEDQIPLMGAYLCAAAPAAQARPMAILIHGAQGDRSTWDPLLGPLVNAGFAVLAFDLRGHGESATPQAPRADFRHMYKDVTGAYLWLRDQPGVDPTRFVLVAAGAGCGVALDYARRDRSVDGLILLSPGAEAVGPDVAGGVAEYGRRPLTLVIGEPERSLADRIKPVAPQAEIKVVAARSAEGASSPPGTALLGRVPGLEQTIVDAVVQAAGPPAKDPVVTSTRGKTYYGPNTNYARSLRPANLRWLSSPAEAEARDLRPPQSVLQQQGTTNDAPPAAKP